MLQAALVLLMGPLLVGTWPAAAGVDEIIFAARQPGAGGHWYENFGYYAQDERAGPTISSCTRSALTAAVCGNSPRVRMTISSPRTCPMAGSCSAPAAASLPKNRYTFSSLPKTNLADRNSLPCVSLAERVAGLALRFGR